MKIWSAIPNIFAVLLMFFLLIMFNNNLTAIERDFDEARLAIAVDYSTDAAFQASLEVEDLGLEYQDLGNVTINPGDSLDIFESVMCINYNISTSEANKMMVEQSIPVAVFACNDGYYITHMVEMDTGEYKLQWSIKKPYVVESNGKSYAVNIYSTEWTSIQFTGGGYKLGWSETGGALPWGANKEEYMQRVRISVNTALTKDMKYQIERRNEWRDMNQIKFFLPPAQTSGGVNPIIRPSILVLMQGVDFASKDNIMNYVGVGGVRSERRRVVVGFREGDGTYYCYEGQLPDAKVPLIEAYFTTVDEAANAGYSPHYEYLTNIIKYDY